MSDAGEDREKAYRRRVRAASIGVGLARRAFRKRKSWLDRALTWVLRRLTAPPDPAADFMRDEMVDAGIGFDAEELRRYEAGATRPSERRG